jgi:HPt (histidine-containing phosphotransfer) domain-containing protein
MLDREILKGAGIDYEDGVRRCGDNSSLYERLLSLFLADDNFEGAKKGLADKDYDELFSRTHEIKGMSGNMSITDVYRTSSNVVALLRAKDYDAIPAAFAELEDAYGKATDAIESAQG